MKPSPHASDDELGRLVGLSLTRQQVDRAANGGEACLDPEVLASYVDGGLSAAARAEAEAHLAACGWCRRALAFQVEADPERAIVSADAQETSADQAAVGGAIAGAATAAAAVQGSQPDTRVNAVGTPALTPGSVLAWTRLKRSARTWLPLAATIIAAAGLWFALGPTLTHRSASLQPGSNSAARVASSTPPASVQARQETSSTPAAPSIALGGATPAGSASASASARIAGDAQRAGSPNAPSATPAAADHADRFAAATATGDARPPAENAQLKAKVEALRSAAQVSRERSSIGTESRDADDAGSRAGVASREVPGAGSRAGDRAAFREGAEAGSRADPGRGKSASSSLARARSEQAPTDTRAVESRGYSAGVVGGVVGGTAGAQAPPPPPREADASGPRQAQAGQQQALDRTQATQAPAPTQTQATAQAPAQATQRPTPHAQGQAPAQTPPQAAQAQGQRSLADGAAKQGNVAVNQAVGGPSANAVNVNTAGQNVGRQNASDREAPKANAANEKTTPQSAANQNAAAERKAGASASADAKDDKAAATVKRGAQVEAGGQAGVTARKAAGSSANEEPRFRSGTAISEAVTVTKPFAGIVRSINGTRWWRIREPGTIEGSFDGGFTWTVEYSDPQVRITRGAVTRTDDCWMIGANGLVLRFQGGRGWTRVSSPTTRALIGITPISAVAATVTDDTGRTYRTTDGGVTWRSAEPAPTKPRP